MSQGIKPRAPQKLKPPKDPCIRLATLFGLTLTSGEQSLVQFLLKASTELNEIKENLKIQLIAPERGFHINDEEHF